MENNQITVVKEFTFDAAHRLPTHPGKCRNMHGHTYKLQIGVTGAPDDSGLVIDFAYIKDLINTKIIAMLDHRYLNDVPFAHFPAQHPTAENMVLWMRDILATTWPGPASIPELTFIRLYETPTSYAEWRKSNGCE